MTLTSERCEICHANRWRRVQTTMPGPEVAICDGCGSVFSLSDVPPATGVCSSPPDETIRDFQGYAPSAFVGSVYDKVLRKCVPLGGDALDIGCFEGAFLAFLRSLGFAPYGLELQSAMAAFCREQGLAVSAGVFPHAVPDDILRHKFDLITALECTCYWEDFDRCASTLWECLKPGGYFLVKLLQGTSPYYDGRHAYSDRVNHFRALLNVDAFKILMERHGFAFVDAAAHTYIYDRRRYHPNPMLRQVYRQWIRAKSAWAAIAWPKAKWDKVVLVFRKPE